MKRFVALTFSIATLAFANIAHATPTQYQFTATHFSEYTTDFGFVASSDYLLADGTSIATTFFYDAATPLTTVIDSANGTGPSSYYSGAITNFTGVVDGHLFSFDSGGTFITNVKAGNSIYGVVSSSAQGYTVPGYPASINFQSFAIGDFKLTALSLYSLDMHDYLSDQSLPAQLTNGSLVTRLNLVFQDSQNTTRYMTFGGSITAVPIPEAGVLFASGMMTLVVGARRRLKAQSTIV